MALRRLGSGDPAAHGYRVTLVSGLAYAAVATWHFIEHANHDDPEVAHVLLVATQVGMILGIVLAFVLTRRSAWRQYS